MEDRRNYSLRDKAGRPLGAPPEKPTLEDRFRRLWTPGMKIRVILLAFCAIYFLKYGISKGAGLVALVAGLMLLVPWFLNNARNALVAARRRTPANRHPYLPLVVSGILLAVVVITAWNEIPRDYVYLSAGIGLVFFLLHALTEPWLRRRTR